MTTESSISPEYIAAALRYEADTGLLFWNFRPDMSKSWNARFAGKPAFRTKAKAGHLVGKINGKTLQSHRVIFAIINGRWPSLHIDHKDGTADNNLAKNIREATRQQNMANRRSRCGTSRL